MKYGEYLGCCVCGCRFVVATEEGRMETNCPMCFSSLILLESITSRATLNILKSHGQFFPKGEK